MAKSIDDVFKGRFLKAADLGDKRPIVTIKNAKLETVDEETKIIVFFDRVPRGLILNVTNANAIAEICGTRNYDEWQGYQIRLIKTKVDFQGKRVDAIRIEKPPTDSKPAPKAEPESSAAFPDEEPAGADASDDIPF